MDSPGLLGRRRRHHGGVAAFALALAGCGGSLYIGVGGDGDRPPDVSLAVSPTSASAGQVVRLVAAATDDFGVARVEFFRISGAGSIALGSDGSPPYALDATLPTGATGTVQFFARAVDDAGQSRDSDLVSVSVLP